MGLRSVVVRDMTGEALSGATMLAAPNAAELQRKILDQVHSVNRRGGDNSLEPTSGSIYRGATTGQPRNEMLDLLRKIESNTRR